MENIIFTIDDLTCKLCGTACKTKNIYDRHIAACDYEPDEPYEMPVAQTRTVDELYSSYLPSESDKKAYSERDSKKSTEFVCECSKVFNRKFNLDVHKSKCKFIKKKEEEEEQTQKQNDKQIISDLRAELAAKDNEIELLKRMLEFAKSNTVLPVVQPVVQPVIQTDVVKKIKPMEFLQENINKAQNAFKFMRDIEVTDYDILESNKSDAIEWFVNIIDRNLKNTCKTIEEYPIHSVIDCKTHKRLMYLKVKDDKRNEWTCEDADIYSMLRKARIAITDKCKQIVKLEQASMLDYAKEHHIPEYDDWNREIEKEWKYVTLENDTTQIIQNVQLLLNMLSDKDKQVLKIMTEKYIL